MDNEDQFLNQVLSGIAEAEVITIFFPLLRRALVIDTRHNTHSGQMVSVLPQVNSMDERIAVIENMRLGFGRVHSILGIPWIKSIASLHDQGITERLVQRLCDSEMPSPRAWDAVRQAISELSRVEHEAFVALIKGDGYQTIWSERG